MALTTRRKRRKAPTRRRRVRRRASRSVARFRRTKKKKLSAAGVILAAALFAPAIRTLTGGLSMTDKINTLILDYTGQDRAGEFSFSSLTKTYTPVAAIGLLMIFAVAFGRPVIRKVNAILPFNVV